MRSLSFAPLGWALALSFGTQVACSSSTSPASHGSGGTGGTGVSAASTGVDPGTGGVSGTAGSSVTPTGGVASEGGTPGSGTGGTSTSKNPGAGGSGSGGANTGGRSAAGGTTGGIDAGVDGRGAGTGGVGPIPGSGGTAPTGGTKAAGGTTAAPGGSTGTPGSGGSSGPVGSSGALEFSGADCPKPTMPTSLPAIADHPDPFLSLGGTRIAKKSDWTCRRAEIKALVEKYEHGVKPVVAKGDVSATFSGGALNVTVKSGSKSVNFSVTIIRPSGAPTGPIPLMIGTGGNNLDASVFSANGIATASVDGNMLGDETAGAGSRGKGKFFDLYGSSYDASSLMGWAWGVSRIIDALELTPSANIDPTKVGVTGCSRNGKGALTVGAFDERIALTIPQESGAGGSSSCAKPR
jgi:hypothetical protein